MTPYAAAERYPAGDYPNQHPGGAGLPEWTKADRSIESTNIVVWYSFGSHHIARAEDWPVMPVVRLGFSLVPDGFFDRNPALDVPPPPHACQANGCQANGHEINRGVLEHPLGALGFRAAGVGLGLKLSSFLSLVGRTTGSVELGGAMPCLVAPQSSSSRSSRRAFVAFTSGVIAHCLERSTSLSMYLSGEYQSR